MDRTFNFNKKTIKALSSPPKITTYHDTQTRGLKLVIRPSGIKTFVLYRKIQGKPERITLGRFPDLSIEKVRNIADRMNAQIAEGINPQDAVRQKCTELTLGEFFEFYLEKHAKLHKRSWDEDLRRYRLHLARWNKRKLSQIQAVDVQVLHATLGKNNGIYAANRILSLLHILYNKAIQWHFFDKANPAHGIKKFKEKQRERFLHGDEMPRFFKAVAEEPNDTMRDYFLISLLTGARRANVLAMRWDQVHLQRKTWTIPLTKNGEPHTLPLVPTAVTLLEERYAKDKESPWVFPGTGKTGHIVETKRAWERILARANIKELWVHDLRRSLGSWQASTGANLSIIGKTLAHKSINTTTIYARLSIDPVRESMEKATDAMLSAAGLSDAT